MPNNPYSTPENIPEDRRPSGFLHVVSEKQRLSVLLGISAILSLLIYLLALLGEIAFQAGRIAFNAPATLPPLLESIGPTTISDMLGLESHPCGFISVVGMAGATLAPISTRWQTPIWLIVVYLVLFVLSGGWLGLLVLPLLPLGTIDGECFSELTCRYFSFGVWGAVVITYLFLRLYQAKRFDLPGRSPQALG